MHAYYNYPMRTTIELDNTNRAMLLELCGRRGLKGFSSIINSALSYYFKNYFHNDNAGEKLRNLFGSLSISDVEDIQSNIHKIRSKWR